MKPNRYQTPPLPTRERALYVAAARIYADAFRDVFIDPEAARRRFRRASELDEERARASLLLRPDEFGPRRLRALASAVHAPAFIYWTLRERRPRALLFRIEALLWAEAAHRFHIQQIEQARKEVASTAAQADSITQQRHRVRARLREAVKLAAHVYARPAQACRAILFMLRRHGARRTRALLRAYPEFFGPLRTVRNPRGVWPLLLVFVTTDEARRWVPLFVTNAFNPAVEAYEARPRCGAVRSARVAAVDASFQFHHLSGTLPEGGALNEAARLLAVLFRRRDVDEKPQGKGPPPIERQLSVMLPDGFAGLIAEAVRLSRKESGEDPIWNRDRGLSRELDRELGRGWGRDGARERGGGLSL